MEILTALPGSTFLARPPPSRPTTPSSAYYPRLNCLVLWQTTSTAQISSRIRVRRLPLPFSGFYTSTPVPAPASYSALLSFPRNVTTPRVDIQRLTSLKPNKDQRHLPPDRITHGCASMRPYRVAFPVRLEYSTNSSGTNVLTRSPPDTSMPPPPLSRARSLRNTSPALLPPPCTSPRSCTPPPSGDGFGSTSTSTSKDERAGLLRGRTAVK